MKIFLPVTVSIRALILLIFIFFLQPIITHGQKLEGVWGLKWGTSVDSAIIKIKKSKGYIPKIKSTDTTTVLVYLDAKWGSETSIATRLCFYKNKLYQGVGSFLPDSPKEFFDTYYNLKQSINDKYFEPQVDFEQYTPPYSKDDSFTQKFTAIFEGYGGLKCDWNFSLKSNLEYDGEITLAFIKETGIILIYEDGIISQKLSKILDDRNKKDF